jgi:hypothetical protein
MYVLLRGRIRGQGYVQNVDVGVKIRKVRGVVDEVVGVEDGPRGSGLDGASQTEASIGFLVIVVVGGGYHQERKAQATPSFLERLDLVLGIIDLHLASDLPMMPR